MMMTMVMILMTMMRRMIIGMGINDNDNGVFAARGKSLNSITTSRRLVGALITVGSIGGHSHIHNSYLEITDLGENISFKKQDIGQSLSLNGTHHERSREWRIQPIK